MRRISSYPPHLLSEAMSEDRERLGRADVFLHEILIRHAEYQDTLDQHEQRPDAACHQRQQDGQQAGRDLTHDEVLDTEASEQDGHDSAQYLLAGSVGRTVVRAVGLLRIILGVVLTLRLTVLTIVLLIVLALRLTKGLLILILLTVRGLIVVSVRILIVHKSNKILTLVSRTGGILCKYRTYFPYQQI